MRELGVENLRALSAGTHAKDGNEADPRAVVVGRELGIDLEHHRARRVTHELLQRVDLTIVMDFVNEARVIALAPEAGDKIRMLGAFRDRDRHAPVEIPDPYEGELSDVRRSCALLDSYVTSLARALQQ
jgi:protein-tyrosine phosphatase